jgi:hypothetical protein
MIKTYLPALMLVTAAVGGCDRQALRDAEARAAAAEEQLVHMNEIASQKDTLLSELMETTSFINDINDELAKIRTLQRGALVRYEERVVPVTEYRDSMLARIRELGARLDDTEARLKQSQSRLRASAQDNHEMLARIAAFEKTVAEYTAVMAEQRAQIALLTAQLETLQADYSRLALEKASLDTQVVQLTTTVNTVYFVAAPKDELIERGITREEGGSRLLLIGPKRGRTLVPAADLDAADFTELDKTLAREIVLPDSLAKYAIVSPHGAQYLEDAPARDGTFRGRLRIRDPDAFWAQSKFLILVER